jgi:hypothetical protein
MSMTSLPLQPVATDESVCGVRDKAFETSMRAFHKGPPGVIRAVKHVDSYPGERTAPDDPPDPDAYRPLPTSVRDERRAVAEAINAYLGAQAELGDEQAGPVRRGPYGFVVPDGVGYVRIIMQAESMEAWRTIYALIENLPGAQPVENCSPDGTATTTTRWEQDRVLTTLFSPRHPVGEGPLAVRS